MWQSYFTIAWRALRRDGRYAALNVAGLAIGIAVTLVIALFIDHKLSFDRFHDGADRIYRITQQDPRIGPVATVPRGLPHRVESRFPEVEAATVLFRYGRNAITYDGRTLFIDDRFGVDRHFFDVFSFEVLRGTPEEALARPGQALLTASTARRIFGADDPMGKTLTAGSDIEYEVAGILADPPATSHFQFNALLSLSNNNRALRTQSMVTWGRFDYHLYVKTRQGTPPGALQEQLDAMAEASSLQRSLVAQPLTRIHLHTAASMNSEIAPQSDVRYLYIFGAVGLLILGIAGANYVNLSTARALRRVREVGVRKTMGATRSQLIRQFLGESVLTVACALPFAVALAVAALPLVNRLAGLQLSVSLSHHGLLLGSMVLFVLVLGLAAGSYPALVLSSFAPSSVLGGHAPMAGRRSRLQGGLVATQFAIAIGLVLGTATVYNQMEYVREAQLGGAEHIVTFRGHDLGSQYPAFKQELDRQPHIASTALGPPPGIDYKSSLWLLGEEEEENVVLINASADYFDTVGLRLIAGRPFPAGATAEDSDAGYIINETLAERHGITARDVGSEVDIGKPTIRVRGIVEDFHNRSLHDPIRSLAFRPPVEPLPPDIEYARSFVVRLNEGETAAGLAAVRAAWDEFVPSRPLDYQFLDDRIEAQYAASQRLLRVFGLFAGIALFVTGLGLLGLTAYMAERRTKEVGIRKAVGATATSIVWLFSKDTARLVGIGVAVGLPLAYLGARQWLQQFAYQAEIDAGLIAGAIAVVALIGLGAASVQSLRAARIDPAETLRYE
jgi:putative ABC transport system permease protein